MNEPVARLSGVFNKAIPVAIAITIHPQQGSLDIRPNALDEPNIIRPLQVGAGEDYEQRRSVDASVVARERHLAQCRHFAVPGFVKNLAGLGVAGSNDFRGLRRCEISKHASRETWIEPETLSAVMMPSRPNGALNHGTPAYG